MKDRRPENQSSYLRVKAHLDEIVEQIRSKDVPLEQALDLYEEAIRLGNSCADLIDTTDFSMEEIEAFNATSRLSDEKEAAEEESVSADDSGEAEVGESAPAHTEGDSAEDGGFRSESDDDREA